MDGGILRVPQNRTSDRATITFYDFRQEQDMLSMDEIRDEGEGRRIEEHEVRT